MSAKIERKCAKCGTWNQDVDYCLSCSNPISLKAQEKIEQIEKKAIADSLPEDRIDVFLKSYKNHRFFVVRWVYYFFNSIAMVFMAIGSFIAYLIAWTAG